MTAIEVAVAGGAALGECPVWDPDAECLYWVDIEGRAVHRYDPATGADEVRVLPGRPGAIARTGIPGRLLVAMETTLVWLDWDDGTVTGWLELEAPGRGVRLNDGRIGPGGRFWVGSMFEDPAAERFEGLLHRVRPDGTADTVQRNIGIANGTAFDPSRNRMYFADTLHGVIWQYEYDADTGARRNQAVFVEFDDFPGRPDGACVDADGCYWIAAVYGWALIRFAPSGRVDRIVELPVEAPTMPAFGGQGLDTLFVTSIGSAASRPLDRSPVAPGALLALDVGVSGRTDPVFNS